jgi:Sulfotransferase family
MIRSFVLGNPRSGTSLLRIMLNNHRQIASPPECGFSQWWLRKYMDWNQEDGKNESRIISFVQDVLTSKKIETWNFEQQELIDFIKSKSPLDYGQLVETVYVAWSNKSSKFPDALVDKNNYYIHHLPDLVRIWPDAKFVFLIRDGRDVACSYLAIKSLETDSPYKPKLPFKVDDIAKEWTSNNQNILNFLEGPESRSFIIVRYEDLINEPEVTLSRISHFLGFEMDSDMMDYYKNNDEPASTLDWKKKTLERPDVNNVGKYFELLTKDEISIFNNTASQLLMKFGYGI